MNLSSKFPLFAVLILLISTGCTDNPYRDEDAENQIASYGVLVHSMTNNHSAAPGYDTDFILTIWNIGSETATYKMEVTHKDEGIETVSFEQNMSNITILADGVLPLIVNVNLSSSATGILRTDIEFSSESNEVNVTTSQKVTLEVNSDVTFDRRSQIGNLVKVHYAGILAKNSKLFDSSMEYVWNTYPYYNDGVSDANVHINTLAANNIGCFEESTKDGVILSFVDSRFSAYEGGLRVGMEVYEFDNQKINTYEEFYDAINATSANQTVAVSVVKEMDPEGFERQCKRLKDLRSNRDKSRHSASLRAIEKAAEGDENLMPHFIEAAKAKATLGEMCDVLRGVFGEYREGSDF